MKELIQMVGQTVGIFIIICVLSCTTPNLQCTASHNDRGVVNIGVVLDYNSWIGKAAKTAVQMAADDVNRDSRLFNGARLVLHFRDSRGDAVEGASAALDLLEREVVAIIGPDTSEVAEFILHLGDRAKVPVVSFYVANPLLSNHRFPYSICMAHSESLQMETIAALVEAYGWRRVTLVYPDDEFGSGAVSSLSNALRDVGSEIGYRSVISPTADQQAIREELYKLMTIQTRVFVVHVHSALASKIFTEAHKIGMMDQGYVWITTEEFTSLWDVLLNSSTNRSMQGLLGVRNHIQNSKQLGQFTRRWTRQFRLENGDEEKAEVNMYSIFAYEAVWTIALAIDKLGNTTFNFTKSPTFIDGKVFQEGPQLLQELIKTKFRGISGTVQHQLPDGKTVGSTFEIVNVVGNGYHVIGYWSYETQLSKELPSSAESTQSNNIERLGTVIWPGHSTKVPRGWDQPTNGKRIKVGVRLRTVYPEFVTVTVDNMTKESKATGFCMDVFEAVLRRLDYALPYETVGYNIGDNEPDDVVSLIYQKNFDAIVGDLTILANRSRFVDFTQPYSESGLSMVVPIKADDRNNVWAFIQPFTPAMWFITGVFFVFTGFVIWLLEHRVNPQFRGKPRSQVVTLLWFSFSTLFFAQHEKLVSGLSRLVVIIWLFVALVLQSSYTASLTSMLTVQQLNPTVTDVQSLHASGLTVGYQVGSFVGEYLHKEFGITKEKLKSYSTPEEAREALRKGPNKGGVAAIFDEIPYIRIFLASYCGFRMVGPIYRTGGFGFVFPKGSLLVSDISRAVLSLSEDKEMREIEAKWLGRTACTDSGATVDSKRLSMDSFLGLYLITGTASLIALIVFFSQLLYNFRRDPSVNRNDDVDMGDPSTGKSLKRALKSFMEYIDHEKDSTSALRRRVSESPSSIPALTSDYEDGSTSALRPRLSESPSSIRALTSSPSTIETNPLSSIMISGRCFSAPSRLQEDPSEHLIREQKTFH